MKCHFKCGDGDVCRDYIASSFSTSSSHNFFTWLSEWPEDHISWSRNVTIPFWNLIFMIVSTIL